MEENAKPKEYISIKDAAELLGRALYTVYHYWHQGKLEGRQYGKGGRIEIDKASVERFLKKGLRKRRPRPQEPDVTTEPAVAEAMAGGPAADETTPGEPAAAETMTGEPAAGPVADPEEHPERRDAAQPGQDSAA